MPITTPPVTWPEAPTSLTIRPESWTATIFNTRTTPVSRSTLIRAAWRAERRGRERFAAETPDAARRFRARRGRRRAGALAEQEVVVLRRSRRASAMVTDRHGLPFTADGPIDELEVGRADLEGVRGQLEQLLADILGRGDHRATVVEQASATRRPRHPRGRLGVLVDDREVVRIDAQDLAGQDRHRHDGAGAALLGAGDDRRGTVGVDLHVRAGRHRERRPPAARDTDRLVLRQLLAVADQLGRPVERLDGVDCVEDLAGRTLVAVARAGFCGGTRPDPCPSAVASRPCAARPPTRPSARWARGRSPMAACSCRRSGP